jgi:hypothetical protein
MGEGKSQVGTARSGSWPLLYPGLIPFNLTLMNIYTKRQKSAVPFTVQPISAPVASHRHMIVYC